MMNQAERRIYLINSLINEDKKYQKMRVPSDQEGQKQLLRGLFNVRMPKKTSKEFLEIQDAYLKEENEKKGVTDYQSLSPVQDGIYLWQGDISSLKCDAIVNAANSQMLGCFVPNHACIDNCIHTFAGIQLREECFELMQIQGHEEETGKAKITAGYNLPAKHVIHTVGPIVSGPLTEEHEELLADCYRSCLEAAEREGLHSVAFSCISTGVFCFPNERAAEIAVETVQTFRREHNSRIDVIFNVFKDLDLEIYRKLLAN